MSYREPDIIERLRSEGIPLDVIRNSSDENSTFQWLKDSFPLNSYSGIDWSKVPQCEHFTWDTDYNAACLAAYLIGRYDFSGVMHVVWSDTTIGAFSGPSAQLAPHLWDIINEAPDTWFLDMSSGYCIEVYHEGTIAVGRKPAG